MTVILGYAGPPYIGHLERLSGAGPSVGDPVALGASLASNVSWHGLKTLRGSGPRYGFIAPSAGRLTLTLQNGRKTLATLTRRVTRAGVVRGRLRATKSARRGVLKRVKPVRAVLTIRFTPSGGKRVQVRRRVTLTR